MLDNQWAFGQKLKNIRKKRKYKIKEAAEALGTSASFISMIENGKSGISLSKLQALLHFYGLTMADLVTSPSENDKIVKLENAIPLGNQNEGIEALLLVNGTKDHSMEPVYFRFQPGATTDFLHHDGQEFAFVIEGVFEVILRDEQKGTEVFKLYPGDTAYYHSTTNHKWTNISDGIAVFLAAVTPASF
ncbi:MAG TPA: helix-turn-helix domain-containing protein [Anaerovoracaceae bacterium]|nr:helix-turn-helix domain-containing protein [Anaerovoracaceae bacterium]